MTNDSPQPAASLAITQRSTISIAFGLSILAAIVWQLNMVSELRNSQNLTGQKVDHIAEGMTEIKVQIAAIGHDSKTEFRLIHDNSAVLHEQVSVLRSRVEDLEQGR